MSSTRLSLRAAIFINLNIILGSGIFINSVLLSDYLGPWGALTYIGVGLLLYPLIRALAYLVTIYKGGSFYDYAAVLHPGVGFLSQWSYFIGKMAASSFGIHLFCSLIKTIFVPLASVSTLILDTGVILFFMALNMLNVRVNKSIQIFFFVLKVIPIILVVGAGLIFFSLDNLINTQLAWENVFITIPFALYAFTGFEATCSLIHTLEDPERDGPRAIIYSYCASVLLAVVFQTFIYMIVGQQLRSAGNFFQAFPLFFDTLFVGHPALKVYATLVIHTAIACSSLGAAYGIIFSNAWNLFTLAEKKLIFGVDFFTRLSGYQVPVACILTEGVIALVYIWYTQGNQIMLQQINTLALTTTFTLSVFGLIGYQLKRYGRPSRSALAACLSCLLLLIFLIKNFIHYRALPALPFLLLVALGIVSFLANFKEHQRA